MSHVRPERRFRAGGDARERRLRRARRWRSARPTLFRARVRWRDGDLKLAADTFEPVEAAEARTGEDLRIVLKEGAPLELLAQTLAALPQARTRAKRGRCAWCLRLKDGREIELATKAMVPQARPRAPRSRRPGALSG